MKQLTENKRQSKNKLMFSLFKKTVLMPLRIYSIYYSLNNLIKPKIPETTKKTFGNAVYKIIILLNTFKSTKKFQEIFPKGIKWPF